MDKRIVPLLLGLGLAALSACGRKGPLVLPRSGAPGPVQGLTAAAGEGGVVLRWTNPSKAVSGRPAAELAAVEIWVFDAGLPPGLGPLEPEAVERTARRARRIPRAEFAGLWGPGGEAAGVMTWTYATGPGTGAAPAFAVRVVDRKGRASAFSGPVAAESGRRAPGVDRPAAPGVC